MSSSTYEPSSSRELKREARDWDLRVLTPGEWQDAPKAIPRVGASTAISLRMPGQMLTILKAFARREGVGYQVLLKRWLDERIREERDKIAMQEDQLTTVKWNVSGWKRLTAHNDPAYVAAREEFLAWLAAIPEPRTDLDRRLKSKLEHPHLSARLELFVHHYFAANGWSIQIHPAMRHTGNRPDFLVERQGQQIIVECKSVLDRHVVEQQEQRLRQLADEFGRKLGVTVMLEPLADLPPSLPVGRIRDEINRRVYDESEIQEVDIRGEHQGVPYGLRATVFVAQSREETRVGVQGLDSQVQTVTVGKQLREALREKAGKYGELHLPFMIAVSAETFFPARTKHELAALFGSEVLELSPSGQVTETRTPDGLFTVTQDGDPRYRRVSAVLVYNFKWLDSGYQHRMHIYHNPYASIPLDPETFPDVPQFVPLTDTQMGWTNGEPAALEM